MKIPSLFDKTQFTFKHHLWQTTDTLEATGQARVEHERVEIITNFTVYCPPNINFLFNPTNTGAHQLPTVGLR